ncbi:hypothetical protein GSI_04050 [Ganoderma sinense ZZ0214-1]|uniref:Uncharacterized protein n=1 Tax=Ganoderma sinense ZZ0214-1 TaxID=1077348 RepID=A0A2G8SIP2_9APHY|nr:hypothetical protein GSI_04050 [Ganoderma sinense ZZ0214-1]
MNRTSLKALGRAGLQRLAKAKGVRAVGPSSKIIDRLLECVKGNSTVSDGTPEMEERVPDVFKDVKNSVVDKGAQKGTVDGSRKSKRIAATVATTEANNKNDWSEMQDATGTRASRENAVVVPPTTRERSPAELNAIQMLLLFQDILPPKSDSAK